MLLSEAKEILKKNGYTLSEDAYTDAMDAEDDEVLRKLRNKYAKTDAEYTPDYVPKLDKILLNLDFVKLHKLVHEHDLTYMGFISGTKYLLGFMIDKDDVITCNVVDKDKRKVQKVTMDIAIDSDNYDREYINVNEFIKNSDSYLNNIKKVVENVKKIDRSSKTKLGRIANGITKALGNDFDTRYSGLRDIGEAVKLLKKNGYELVEVYDAVTDRNNVKNSRQREQSYFTKLMKRLKLVLAEKGIKAIGTNNSLRIGNWTIWVEDESSELAFVGPSDKIDADLGPESGEDASFRANENDVTLVMYSGMKHVDTADFDVRNIPSMVKWILDHIER